MITSLIFAVLGALCLIYYFIIVVYSGLGTSFAPAWLVAFVFFAAISVLQFLDYRKVISILPWIKRVAAALVIMCFALFFVLEGLVISGMLNKPERNLDYIIVMGAQVRGDVPSKSLRKRIEKAAEYLNDNPDTVAIVSGGKGNGENISEADCMYDHLIEYGIAANRIIKEDKATSTEENIEFSMDIIEELGITDASIGIITNNFHVYRTTLVCAKKGVEVTGIPADADNILLINYMVREAFAIVRYKLGGVI